MRWAISLSSVVVWLLCEAAFGSSGATCLVISNPHRDHTPEFLAKVHKLIEPRVPPLLQIRVDPSFDQDHAVILYGRPEGSSLAEAKHLYVRHYIADRNIGYSLPRYQHGKDEKVSVSIATQEIPRALGERVYHVWSRMLIRAAKSEKEFLRVDPTTVDFSFRDSRGSHHVRAYEPYECDDSYLLAQVGGGLIACCHPEKFNRAWALKLLEKRTRAAEEFLKRHAHD